MDVLRGYVRRADLFREHAGATFSVEAFIIAPEAGALGSWPLG
jgi:hypothetical protein